MRLFQISCTAKIAGHQRVDAPRPSRQRPARPPRLATAAAAAPPPRAALTAVRRLSLDQIPFVDADDQRAALARDEIGDASDPASRSGMAASSSSTTTSANLTARKASAAASFSNFSSTSRALAQPGGVEHLQLAGRCHSRIDADGIAGDARLRAGEQPLLAEDAIDQGRFAGIGPADDGDAQRLCGIEFAAVLVIVKRQCVGGFCPPRPRPAPSPPAKPRAGAE